MNSNKAILLFLAATLVILAVVTVMPDAQARMVNHLGYRAVCPFSPYSTLTLLAMSGVFYVIARALH